MKSIKEILEDPVATIIAVLEIGAAIWLVFFILINVFHIGKDYLEVERESCKEMVEGNAMVNGQESYCDYYIGSDGKQHVKLVMFYDYGETEDVYFRWDKNGQKGKY